MLTYRNILPRSCAVAYDFTPWTNMSWMDVRVLVYVSCWTPYFPLDSYSILLIEIMFMYDTLNSLRNKKSYSTLFYKLGIPSHNTIQQVIFTTIIIDLIIVFLDTLKLKFFLFFLRLLIGVL